MNIQGLTLPEEFHNHLKWVKKQYVAPGLKWGWKSNTDKDYDSGHWSMPIIEQSRYPYDQTQLDAWKYKNPAIAYIWENIKPYVGAEVYPWNIYVSGSTYGVDAYTHKDTNFWITTHREPEYAYKTIVVYLNEEWEPDWGGETMFFDDQMNIATAMKPEFGKVAIFDSMIYHGVRPLARICTDLRMTLMFKCIDARIYSPEVAFLRSEKIKADQVPHAHGKTLLEHLMGTMRRLEDLGARNELVLAGLYHSVYGTSSFDAIGNGISVGRSEVREVIGEEAEEIVYEFFKIAGDRINTLCNNTNGYDKVMLSDLIKIEIANLEDQNINSMYSSYLFQLYAALEKIA